MNIKENLIGIAEIGMLGVVVLVFSPVLLIVEVVNFMEKKFPDNDYNYE
jgi:hypothetical protein